MSIQEQGRLIINYHYCVSEGENPWLARTAVEPAQFAVQMARLREAGSDVMVTFDDGTSDVFRNAVPALLREKISCILFCCSLPLMESRLLNVTKVHMLQSKLGLGPFMARFNAVKDQLPQDYELDDPARIGLGRIYRYDEEEVRQFKLLLNVKLPVSVLTRILDILFDAEFGSQADAARQTYMGVDELRRCHDDGITIGLHTHSHSMLSRMSGPEQEREINLPRQYFAEKLQLADMPFSYPFGVTGTWNADTKRLLGEAGIRTAYTLGRTRYNQALHTDTLEIPRFDVNDVFARDSSPKMAL